MSCHLQCGYTPLPSFTILYDEENDAFILIFSSPVAGDVDGITLTGTFDGDPITITLGPGDWIVVPGTGGTQIVIPNISGVVYGAPGGGEGEFQLEGVGVTGPSNPQHFAPGAEPPVGPVEGSDAPPPPLALFAAQDNNAAYPYVADHTGGDAIQLNLPYWADFVTLGVTHAYVIVDGVAVDVSGHLFVHPSQPRFAQIARIVEDEVVEPGDIVQQVRLFAGAPGDPLADPALAESVAVHNQSCPVISDGIRRTPRVESMSTPGGRVLIIEGKHLDTAIAVADTKGFSFEYRSGARCAPSVPINAGACYHVLARNPARATMWGAFGNEHVLDDTGVVINEWSEDRIELEFGPGPAIPVSGVLVQTTCIPKGQPQNDPLALVGGYAPQFEVTIAAQIATEPEIEEVVVTP